MFPSQLRDPDRVAVPASYVMPYAKYFRPDALPVLPHLPEQIIAGMAPSACEYDIEEAMSKLIS